MTYKPRSERKRASGGKAEMPLRPKDGNLYNAVGSPESRSIRAKADGFKRGGMTAKVEGAKGKGHLAKRARGGSTSFSEAHNISGPGNEKGSPGEQAPEVP